MIDLGADKNISGVWIENRPGDNRSAGLKASISSDGLTWTQVWQAGDWDDVWEFPVTQIVAGAEVPGRHARYVKLEKTSESTPALASKKSRNLRQLIRLSPPAD